ncbi:MAG: hypothetical protein R3E87_11780 [Burkholderiaceae bacterium]
MKTQIVRVNEIDTLAIARQARGRRDAVVGMALRRLFTRTNSAAEARRASDIWGNALAPLGAATR